MARRKSKKQKVKSREMLFKATNYKILLMGLLLVLIGFVAMYMENEVNGFISLFISPILILAGYGVVIFSIMKREDSTPTETQTSAS